MLLDELNGRTLQFEEWETHQILRPLANELRNVLRPAATRRACQTAAAIAGVLGPDHPAFAFFAEATDGFSVERA